MSKKIASKAPGRKTSKSSKPTKEPAAKQPEMKTSEIRDLIDFISKTGLNEVDIETKELKLHVKREPDQKVFKSSGVTPITSVQPVAQSYTAPPTSISKEEKSVEARPSTPAVSSTTVEIKSPMIGTFYRSATPDSPVFVSVGDKVSKGQT